MADGAITQEELNSLLSSLNATTEKEPDRHRGSGKSGKIHEARVHDFSTGETLSRETLHALELAYVTFARSVSNTLSSYLHTRLQVALLSLDQSSFEQFARSVSDPTVCSLFSIDPLRGKAILEINPAIGYWLIDLMLGGEGELPKSPRLLTDVERSLIEGPITRILAELPRAWENIIGIRPLLFDIVQKAVEAEIAQNTDPVVVASFEVTAGSLTGTFSICIPSLSLKLSHIDSRYSGHLPDEEKSAAMETAEMLQRRLSIALDPVLLKCSVCLGHVNTSPAILSSLKEGDVLCLDRAPSEPLDLLVGDTPKFHCRPISIEGGLAVEII